MQRILENYIPAFLLLQRTTVKSSKWVVELKREKIRKQLIKVIFKKWRKLFTNYKVHYDGLISKSACIAFIW